jgi:hypothetical protein
MKTNPLLQSSIGLGNVGVHASKAWYAAHVLMSALQNSPSTLVRAASPAVIGKRAIPAFAGITAKTALTAAQNTTGFAAGERSAGRPAVAAQAASGGYAAVTAIAAIPASPAYAIGVAVPAVVAVPARAEQVEVIPIAAVTAVTAPAVVAIKGYEDAIEIIQTATELKINAELPVVQGVGIVGSSQVVIGEITPSALQATAWLDEKESESTAIDSGSPSITTMERLLYINGKQCEHIETDVTRMINGVAVPCKRLEITLYSLPGFDWQSDSLQLSKIQYAAQVGS